MSFSAGRRDGQKKMCKPPLNAGVLARGVAAIALSAVAAAGGGLMTATDARAGFTPILAPPAGEKTHAEIMSTIYGGAFVPVGVNFSNGLITAIRIPDTIDPPVSGIGITAPSIPLPLFDDPNNPGDGGLDDKQPPATATDQVWRADRVDAVARARFATFSNQFGWIDGTAGLAYQNLFWVSGSQFNVGGTSSLNGLSNHTFRWGRDGDQGVFSSQNGDNSDTLDHMITYRIISAPISGVPPTNETTYLLFWEDSKHVTKTYDADFNDMVVEIQATQAPVPEPAMLGALGVAGAAVLRRRRRRV